MDTPPSTPGHAISVVVPVYNGQGTIVELVARLRDTLASLASAFEVVLVNDGSRDASWEAICRLSKHFPELRGIDLLRNCGQHNALLAGIRSARYDLIVTIDDDLQHPPEEIVRLVTKLAEGYDLVYGTPEHEQHELWRVSASKLTKFALRIALGAEWAQKAGAFRVFHRDLSRAFEHYQSPLVNIDVLLSWGATRIGAVPVRHQPRATGMSNYNFGKLAGYAVTMITGFTVLPLRLATFIGFTFTLLGVGIMAYVVARYFAGGDVVPGFPFLASVICLFSGAQLFALGIIGEYLGSIHRRSMDLPPYVVRQVSEHGVETVR